MSSTSRVLGNDEMAVVTPVWWRETAPKREPPPAREVSKAPAAPSEADRERIEREAYQRGFAEGKSVAKEQSTAEAQPMLERLSRSLAEMASLRGRMRREAEKDLVKLSIAIARRVLHRELTLDPASIEGLIKVALEKLESHELCRARVHPDQEQIVRGLLDRLGQAKVEMVADNALSPGDVLLDTANGTIDASVDAQLREIERGLADRLRN